MKKILFNIILMLLSLTLFHSLQAQDAVGGMVYSSDSTRCVGEKTVITLTGHYGEIFWQSSPAGANTWTLLSGAGKDSVLIQYPLEDTDYRAILDVEDPNNDAYSSILPIDVLDADFSGALGYSDDICGKDFALSAEGANPGSWSVKSGPGTAEYDPDLTSVDVNVLVSEYGEYVFAFTNGSGGCAAVNIETFEQNKAVATDGLEHCSNVIREPFRLSASLSNNRATGLWSRIGTSYTIDSPGDTNTYVTPTSPVQGVYSIRWREYYGACSDDIVINFSTYIQPEAEANSFGEECDTIGSLSATSVLRYTSQKWEQVSGTPGALRFTAANDLNTDAIASFYGAYQVQWKVENNYCSDSVRFRVVYSEDPIANAGDSDEVCGDTVFLNAVPSVDTGQWSYVGSDILIFGDDEDPNTWVYNNQQYDPFQLVWKETNSICEDSDTITISFHQQPQADAGNNDSLCSNQAIMNAIPSVGEGEWYGKSSDGSAIFTSPTAENSLVTVTGYGIYEFTWKETNEICSDSMIITYGFFEQPEANAGLGGDTCGLFFPVKAIKSVDGSDGSWFKVSGEGQVQFESGDLNTYVAGVDIPGLYEFSWIEENVICVDTSSAILVEYLEVPKAEPGEYDDVCGLVQQLSAADYGVPGVWSGQGISFAPDNSNPNAMASVADTGLFAVNWLVDNGSCTADSTIELHFRYRPNVSVEQGGEVCGDNTLLRATTDIGIGNWSEVGGNNNVFFQDPTSLETIVQIEDYGAYQFKWKVNNGDCADSAIAQASFFEIPIVDCGNDSLVCGLEIILLANVNVGDGIWQQESGAGLSNFNPDNTTEEVEITASEPGVYSYVRIQQNNICTSSDTVQVEYLNQPIALIDTIFPLYNAFETPLVAQNIRQDESGEWTILDAGSGQIDDVYSYETVINNLSFGENPVMWAVTNGVCTDNDTMTIMVYDIFIPEVITPNGDGDNDVFEILGLEDVKQAELIIYNRWGAEIYKNSNYQDDNNWDGTNKSGTLLANDTYFYVLNIDDSRAIKGFVVIKI